MNKPLRIAIAGCSLTALLFTGCTADSQNTASESPQSETPVAQAQPLPKPLVPVSVNTPIPANRSALSTTLLQPTSPADRLATVTTGRADPFAAVVTNPIVVPVAPTRQQVPSLPPIPTAGVSLPATTALPPVPLPAIKPANPALPEVAPSPSALAQAIEITGVVQLGTTVSAIVKIPEDGSGRYVYPGDVLAGGRVVVKRIEVGPDREPVVVLEQNGLEVIKSVGASGTAIARAL